MIIVTGGGSGIGRCTAHEIAALGATVALVGRKPRQARRGRSRDRRGRRQACETHAFDIREEEAGQGDASPRSSKAHGRIHGLVNNAGGQFPAPLDAISQKGFETVVRNNLTGGFLMAASATRSGCATHGGVDRQHGRRHVERHARHGAHRRGARRHGQPHHDGGLRMGRRRRARQCRGAGLDRLVGHGHLSRASASRMLRKLTGTLPAAAGSAPRARSRPRSASCCRDAAAFITGADAAHRRRRADRQAPRRPAPHDRSKPFNGFHRAIAQAAAGGVMRCHPGISRANIRDPRCGVAALDAGSRLALAGMTVMAILESRSTELGDVPRQPARHAGADRASSARSRRACATPPTRSSPRFEKRGQLMPRERLALLLDRGAPFLELSRSPALDMHDDDGARTSRAAARSPASATSRACAAWSPPRLRHQGRHRGADGPAQEPARAADRAARTSCRSCTWSNRAAPTSSTRPRSSSTAAAASPTRRACRRGHPAGHRRARLLDRGRRLPAGPLRLRHHGAQAAQDLPRRPAAAEGRDRRDRDRRGARRRRDARRRSRASPSTWPRTTPTRIAHGARDHAPRSPWNERLPPLPRKAVRGAALRHRRAAAASCRPTTASPTTCAR